MARGMIASSVTASMASSPIAEKKSRSVPVSWPLSSTPKTQRRGFERNPSTSYQLLESISAIMGLGRGDHNILSQANTQHLQQLGRPPLPTSGLVRPRYARSQQFLVERQETLLVLHRRAKHRSLHQSLREVPPSPAMSSTNSDKSESRRPLTVDKW